MAEKHQGCVASAKGPKVVESAAAEAAPAATGGTKVQARVGKPAPDFEATAFVAGGFKNISLSDYKGQWVVLCFYPGDFTFV